MALTAKQEKFCQAIVSGMSQADAYRHAYDASRTSPQVVQNKGSLLMKKDEVRVRVESLRAPVVAKVQYGLEQAMEEAHRALKVAEGKENGGAMVAAVQLRAKLNGLLVERKEIRTGLLDDLPYDETAKVVAALEAIQRQRSGASLH